MAALGLRGTLDPALVCAVFCALSCVLAVSFAAASVALRFFAVSFALRAVGAACSGVSAYVRIACTGDPDAAEAVAIESAVRALACVIDDV